MKKLICIFLTLILVFAMTTMLAACDSNKLKGTWEGFGYEIEDGDEKEKEATIKLYINNDNIYVIRKDPEESISSKKGYLNVYRYTDYKIFEKDMLVVFYDKECESEAFYYEFKGENLILKNGDYLMVLNKI